MRLSDIFLYRWWKGGKWVFFEGRWHQVQNYGQLVDFVSFDGWMVHYTYSGIQKREDFT